MEFKYPRVSDILKPYSNIALAQVPKENLENAAKRGTILHQYCVAYARGDFVPEICEDYLPYFESYVQWHEKNVEEVLFSETRLYHDGLKYCGQPDLVVRLKGVEGRVLIDLKSATKIYETYPVQLAAYMDLCNLHGLHCEKGIILSLKKTGKAAKAYDYADCNPYFRVFLFGIELYNYFFRK